MSVLALSFDEVEFTVYAFKFALVLIIINSLTLNLIQPLHTSFNLKNLLEVEILLQGQVYYGVDDGGFFPEAF